MYFDMVLTPLSLTPSNTGEQLMTTAIVQEAIEENNDISLAAGWAFFLLISCERSGGSGRTPAARIAFSSLGAIQ